jgi:uroporphyrinogen III methyltransferase/synthase
LTYPVLVTRPFDQAADLCRALEGNGIRPVAVPTVAIDRSSAVGNLDRMIDDGLDGAAWLVVTSANGAGALAERLAVRGRRIPAGTRLAAVGPATADVLQAAGLEVHHVPDEYLTVAIADGLGDVAGKRVVLARADAATPQLREALLAARARVTEVVAYRTVEGPADSRDALNVALRRDLAGVAFTSSSTVRGLLLLASPTGRQRARALPAFCIGPITAETARRSGFDVEVVAAEHTSAGLATAIANHLHQGDS